MMIFKDSSLNLRMTFFILDSANRRIHKEIVTNNRSNGGSALQGVLPLRENKTWSLWLLRKFCELTKQGGETPCESHTKDTNCPSL